MPTFDTPITTSDQNLDKVLAQKLPVLLVLHRNDIDKPLEDALNKEAKKRAGNLLVVRINAQENQTTYSRYGNPATPALVTLSEQRGKHTVKSQAATIRPADIRAHSAHLLEDAPLPTAAAKSSSSTVDKPVAVTDASFRDEVLKSKVPVLVDFWADWCGPCRMIAPQIEQLAKEYAGKLKVAKLDVDRNQVMAQRYQVQSIPTMIVFENGQPAERIVGANATALRKAVQRFVR
jgi:thioredoxin